MNIKIADIKGRFVGMSLSTIEEFVEWKGRFNDVLKRLGLEGIYIEPVEDIVNNSTNSREIWEGTETPDEVTDVNTVPLTLGNTTMTLVIELTVGVYVHGSPMCCRKASAKNPWTGAFSISVVVDATLDKCITCGTTDIDECRNRWYVLNEFSFSCNECSLCSCGGIFRKSRGACREMMNGMIGLLILGVPKDMRTLIGRWG